MGHQVHVIAEYTLEKTVREGQVVDLGFCSYQILNCENNLVNRLLINKKRYNGVKEYLDRVQVDYIIINSFPFDYKKMKQLMQRKRVPYMIEVCEWLDASSFRLGKMDIRYMLNQIALKKRYIKENKILAISWYLQRYFTSHKVQCLRIPTILDLEEHKCNLGIKSDKFKIMYAGNPGKNKELLGEILKAIALLKQEDSHFGEKFCFDIYGINKEQVLLNIQGDSDLLSSVQDCIQIKGVIDQKLINAIYQEHNFSIFMRPHRRSSNAGFPTKLAESLAAGTPVLANKTGDIPYYIGSGKNGFVVENEANELKKLFHHLVSMEKEEYCEMRRAARETAEKSFDYKVYERKMEKFINE